jgi:hypothetical protein
MTAVVGDSFAILVANPMRKPHGTGRASSKKNLFLWPTVFCAAAIVFLAGCSAGPPGKAEYVYVAIPEASLWDRVATIHSKTGLVHNGERLQVLERMQSRRFVRVRSPRGEEGWVQERYLAEQQTFDQFRRLADQFKATAAQASATIEQQVKVHILPGRKTPYLYLLNEKEKVELLQRQPVDRNASPGKEEKPKDNEADASDEEDKSGQPAILEDWWLVRDSQQRVGWVLGRALYLDVPEEIAQYAEGRRIVAIYSLDDVQDHDKKVTEYLALLTEPKDGLQYDFDQIRVYTWNTRKHRYETAYREHGLFGTLPVSLGRQEFEKEGSLRTFTLQLKDKDGQLHVQLYKFNPPIVRKVFAPGEKPPSKTGKSHRKG